MRYEIFIDKSPDPQTTGTTRLADLSEDEAARLRGVLDDAFETNRINDYGINPESADVMDFSDAFAWVTKLVSR